MTTDRLYSIAELLPTAISLLILAPMENLAAYMINKEIHLFRKKFTESETYNYYVGYNNSLRLLTGCIQ